MSPADFSSRADAPGLVALDALSRQLLAAAAPRRVEAATTAADLEAVHRLRYAHVIEHGWARPEDHPDGLERDGYDQRAVQIAAWDAGRLAGSLRLVLPEPGAALPVEDAFGLVVEPRGAVVDVGRLLIAPGHRGDPAHTIWGALFGRAWLEARARGFTVLAGTATPEFIARYRAIDLVFELLGPARPYWGELRHPVRLDPSRDGAPGWFTSPRR
jgi:N-acyl amino acid synthase FeeM